MINKTNTEFNEWNYEYMESKRSTEHVQRCGDDVPIRTILVQTNQEHFQNTDYCKRKQKLASANKYTHMYSFL